MTENESETELASLRTDMSEDRTIMSNERTFAGWARTGLAAMGIALGFNALFGKLQPSWIPKLIASAFLILAVFIFISAFLRAKAVLQRLDSHDVKRISRSTLALMTCAMTIGTLALIPCVWLLDWTQ